MTASPAVVAGDSRSATRRAFANRTFVVSYVAEAQSIFGDQLARVALSVLVFELTGSTPATAATYAATFLPAIFGGALLGRIGDRLSRRTVMVGCDLVRALCFGVIALWPHDIALVVVLVVLAVTLGPAFSAAQLGLLATRLDIDEFTAGNAARLITSQAAQVGGFAVGGVVVAAFDPAGALTINAVTFALSAVVLRVLIPADRVADTGDAADSVSAATLGAGNAENAANAKDVEDAHGTEDPVFSGLWRDRAARPLVIMSLCIGFFVVPEGLAVPFAAALDASSRQAGFLLASGALGGAVGATLIMRLSAPNRAATANMMAALCGLPLVLSAILAMASTTWWTVALCWLVSGALAAYVVEPTSRLMHAIPDAQRSRTVGVLSALLLGSQGIAVFVFGVLAAATSPSAAVGIAGATGCVLVTAVLALERRVPRRGRHAFAG